MVDLDPLSDKDLDLLHSKIHKHLHFTNSVLAQKLLDNWETESHNFVKVMPRDYKKALAKKEAKVEELVAV